MLIHHHNLIKYFTARWLSCLDFSALIIEIQTLFPHFLEVTTEVEMLVSY